MKTLSYVGNFDIDLLRSQLLLTFPSWRVVEVPNRTIDYFGIDYFGGELTLYVPDAAIEADVDTVVKNHDASAAKPIDWPMIIEAKNAFLDLPNYATWTPQEAADWIHNDVLSGWGETEINAWIDTNVTTLATARTGLKMLSKEIIDLRETEEKLAYMLMLLRNIVIKRSLL